MYFSGHCLPEIVFAFPSLFPRTPRAVVTPIYPTSKPPRYLRMNPAVSTRLVDLILTKTDSLCHTILTANGCLPDIPIAMATKNKTASGGIGALCTTLRSYCALVILGRPGVIRSRQTRIALSTPIDTLEAMLAAAARRRRPGPPTLEVGKGETVTLADGNDSSPHSDEESWQGGWEGGRKAATAAAAGAEAEIRASAIRLEELTVCVILVTAGRVGGLHQDTMMAGGESGGVGGGGGSGEGDAVADAVADAAARGRYGMRIEMESCVASLRRLVSLDGQHRGGRDAGADPGGGGRGVVVGGSSVCCCAGLYATLLLRGWQLRALSEVVGRILGCSPALSGPEGIGESRRRK